MEYLDFLNFLIVISIICFFLFIIFGDADLTLLFYHYFAPKKDFHGQVIWITGASSGIGEYLAYSMVKRGAKLALSGVNVERLEKVKRNCLEMSGCSEKDILLVPFSIQNYEEHEKSVNKVLEYFNDIDILVNNAGVSQRAEFQDIDICVDEHLFSVNVFGAISLTRKVLPHFLKRKKGYIVATSSVAGKLGAPYSSAYTGSKHAMHGYFECLRLEMIHENIDVTLVCPGPVYSLITDRCLTGKLGETYGHTQSNTDRKMKTERCSELMATAMAYRVAESWISIQPILLFVYLAQYTPTFFKTVLMKIFFSRNMAMKFRQGR